MSTGTEDFDKLRRLLKLKRHEQPPPGYFNHFSQHVISRLEADAEEVDEQFAEAPWVRKFLGILEANRFLAGALGTLVCGALVAGVIFSQQGDDRSMATVAPAALTVEYASAPVNTTKQAQGSDSLHPNGGQLFGTNSSESPFGSLGAQLQPASFNPAN